MGPRRRPSAQKASLAFLLANAGAWTSSCPGPAWAATSPLGNDAWTAACLNAQDVFNVLLFARPNIRVPTRWAQRPCMA